MSKYCIECRFCQTIHLLSSKEYSCNAPRNKIVETTENLVLGPQTRNTYLAFMCSMQRDPTHQSSKLLCGPEGRWFEPKPSS